MKYPGKNKSARTGIRVSLPLLILVLVIVASVLIIYSTPVLTIEKRTSGNLTFIDGAGDLVSGTIEINMIGAPPGRKSNVNSITWRNAPNAWIYFDAYEKENISINLRISGDSPNGRVSLEDHGAAMPGSVGVPVPGVPVKYVELHSTGVSFADADISIYYTDAELKGLDETSLVIYNCDGGAWTELPTRVDAAKNVVSTAVVTLSVFAVSAKASERIEIRDTRGMPVTSEVRTYDEAKNVKKHAKTSTLSAQDVPERGELEVDALASKNIAVKLKVKAINKGEIVLDDFGKNNPVSVPLPGRAVKYVEIGANGISFSSANITIRYTDADLNGGNEYDLTIFHWNSAVWEQLPTVRDIENNTLTASAPSLSVFAVAEYNFSTGYGANKWAYRYQIYNAKPPLTNDTPSTEFTSIEYNNISANDGIFQSDKAESENYYAAHRFKFNIQEGIASINKISVFWNGCGNHESDTKGATLYVWNRTSSSYMQLNSSTSAVEVNLSGEIISGIGNYIDASGNLTILVEQNSNTRRVSSQWRYSDIETDYIEIGINYTSANLTVEGNIRDKDNNPLNVSITAYDANNNLLYSDANTRFNWSDIPGGGYVQFDALSTKDVSAKFKLSANSTNSAVILDRYSSNPEAENPPGTPIKYVNVSASNLNYSSVEIKIRYTDAELGGQDENRLVIYHYKNGAWSELSTGVDAANNTLSASTDSLSIFAASMVGGFSQLKLAANRGAVFGPWVNYNDADFDDEVFTIRAYALKLNSTNKPESGIDINFTIYSGNGILKATAIRTTDINGIANFSNNTRGQFTTETDSDFGVWRITAVQVSDANINATTYFRIDTPTNNDQSVCHMAPGTGSTWMGRTCSSGTYVPRSPYTSITGTSSAAYWTHSAHTDDQCLDCHMGYGHFIGTAINSNSYSYGVHDGKKTCVDCHGSGATKSIPSCYNSSCHPARNTNLTSINTLNGSNSTYSDTYPVSSNPLKSHDFNSNIPCIICHNSMHNTTKPDPSVSNTSNITEYTQCTSCHNAYKRHNNSVNCTVCHSQDAHVIKVFAQNATYINGSTSSFRGNCTSCHQNSTFMNALLVQPKAGSYSGSAPQVANPVKHSNDESAGSKWKSYWTAGDQLSSCKYCHGETLHKTIALGRPSLWKGNNTVNSTIGNTTWCSSCHYQGYANGTNTYNDMVTTFTGDNLSVPPEISGNSTYGANTSIYEYTNHLLYPKNDSTCNRCHGYKYGFTRITQLVHNQTRVGGANCADCHDIGGIALLAHVNVTAANDTDAIHKNLSKNAAHVLNTSIYYDNNLRCWACHGNGSEPSIPNAHPTKYKIPYNCTDCHIQSASQNFNFTPNNTLLNVSEHYWNGTDIRTPNATSCYRCHNLSEMMILAKDPDSGSGAVYGGANGGNNSTSHYGKKRNDIRIGISANCSYCHQNISTAFAAAMIDPTYNRSINNHSSRYSSSNPNCTAAQCHSTGFIHNSTLTKPNLTLPNSTFCLNCHGKNASSGLINFTGAVTSIKEKHNNSVNCTECHQNTSRDIHPEKYLQPNATFSTNNTTAVTCITCHQNSGADSKLSKVPPKIPSPLAHSDNTSNGTIWNSTYWTSTLTACTYCHNDTKHNATALGRPANWKGNNIVNSSLSAGTWCASCHYRNYTSGGKNYSNMTGVFTSANLPVPPEITNGSYAVNIYNRSNYYNHSLKNYSDAVCRLCHGVNLSSTSRISAFLHNISWGSCTSCHYSFEAMNNTTRPDRYVDSGMYNTSLHRSLSCTNCHTKGHKNIGARKACEDCHAVQANPITDRDRHNITPTPSTYYYNSVNVVNITDCTTCHSGTLYNTSIATYGYGKSKDCDYCHTYPDKYYE